MSLPLYYGRLMREIILTKGYKALVDDDDFEIVNQFSWHAAVKKATGKVYAYAYIGGGRKNSHKMSMHRLLIEVSDGHFIDHIDGNGLNNCRNNLRTCSQWQNSANRGKPENRQSNRKPSSRYKGVHKPKQTRKFAAGIMSLYVETHLGYFESEIDAARAYDTAAQRLHGNYAVTNLPLIDLEGCLRSSRLQKAA